jgi:CheY-like chemotaxis protein
MAPAAALRQGSETVLAVEDNADLRRTLSRHLTDLGYAVIEAADATAALAVLRQGPVDLLFTDIVMPGELNGYELARRATIIVPGICIVLTSGFSESRIDAQVALPSKARCLSKPCRKADLARVLRDALDT